MSRVYCLRCGRPRDDDPMSSDECQESDSGVHEYADEIEDEDEL